jgi:hypothetical protein
MTAPAESVVTPQEAETLGQIYGYLLGVIRANRARRLAQASSTPAGDGATAQPQASSTGLEGDHA